MINSVTRLVELYTNQELLNWLKKEKSGYYGRGSEEIIPLLEKALEIKCSNGLTKK